MRKKFSTMAQISPKVFETMAYGCVPVVVGDYLPDEFVPFENYIPIAMTDRALELLFPTPCGRKTCSKYRKK